MRTKRIHNVAALKQSIKERAAEGRNLRNQARATTGLDRHHLKVEARSYGDNTRYELLAYGYLRGRTIAQMESLATSLLNFPSAGGIIGNAKEYFLRGPEADPWQEIIEGETTTTMVQTTDNRGLFARLVGTPAPEPKVRTVKWSEPQDPPGWEEFTAMIEADVKAWIAKCRLHAVQAAALKRKRLAERAERAAKPVEQVA